MWTFLTPLYWAIGLLPPAWLYFCILHFHSSNKRKVVRTTSIADDGMILR